MSNLTKTLAAFGMAVGLMTLAPLAQADEWNKKTILTVNEPIEIPGAVLEPGKYVVRLVDSQSNRNIVRFMNEQENEVISTAIAIPNERLQPTGKTEFGWYETPANQPPALRAWFYPGDMFGQEFVYPEGRGTALATATGLQVPKMAQRDADMLAAQQQVEPKPAPSGPTAEEMAQARERELQRQRQAEQAQRERELAAQREREQQQQLAQNREMERQRELEAQRRRQQEELEAQRRRTAEARAQTAADNAPREELPETAGFTPLLGLLAGLSFGTAAVVRRIRRS